MSLVKAAEHLGLAINELTEEVGKRRLDAQTVTVGPVPKRGYGSGRCAQDWCIQAEELMGELDRLYGGGTSKRQHLRLSPGCIAEAWNDVYESEDGTHTIMFKVWAAHRQGHFERLRPMTKEPSGSDWIYTRPPGGLGELDEAGGNTFEATL